MIGSRESVAKTIKHVIARRPVLEPILKAFEDHYEARATLPRTLLPLVIESGLQLPELTEEHANQGRSMMAGMSLKGFAPVLQKSAETMLPLLAKQEHLKPYIDTLELFFGVQVPEKPEEGTSEEGKAEEPSSSEELTPTEALADAIISADGASIEKIAKAADLTGGLSADILYFAAHFIISPALHALVMRSVPAVAENADLDEQEVNKKMMPAWDKHSAWKQGYCPVCGAMPSISYLDRALMDENNEFLAGGGGKKYLHCSLCGSNWHFRRGACPACDKEGADVMEIMREEKGESGERLDWCTKCKSYCPAVDLRARGSRPDFDTLALGMMHLDLIAAKKKLKPLNPSFWNTF
ncbi:MAG: formate dehydrogenase accessory protein FdhE [Pseudomonadota bacterium]